jgi:HEAT repeat protein
MRPVPAGAAAALAKACQAAGAAEKYWIAIAIGHLGPAGKEAAPTLAGALRDRDSWVRAAVVSALGDIGPAAASAIPAMQEALKLSHGSSRRVYIEAWAKMGPAAVPVLASVLQDQDPFVVEFSLRGLASLGPAAASAAPAIEKVLTHEKRRIRELALDALDKVGVVRPVALQPLLRSKDSRIRERAIHIIEKHRAWTSDDAEALMKLLASAIPHEVVHGFDPEERQRTAAADALVKLGRPAVPALKRALNHPNWQVRVAVAEILGRIGPDAEEALPALRRTYEQYDVSDALGVPSLHVTEEQLSDAEVREAVEEAVGRITAPSAQANKTPPEARAGEVSQRALNGQWTGKWSGGSGTADVSMAGNELTITYTETAGSYSGSTYIIRAKKDGSNRLVGKWHNQENSGVGGAFSGTLVRSDRIDGTWGEGAYWNFRRTPVAKHTPVESAPPSPNGRVKGHTAEEDDYRPEALWFYQSSSPRSATGSAEALSDAFEMVEDVE